MPISTKGIYALEAMIDLAIYSKEKVESIKNIARRRDLSEKYLEQIFRSLRLNHLVISVRGANGGYKLAKKVQDINVKDILIGVGENLIPTNCLIEKGVCNRDCDKCISRTVWQGVWDAMNSVIDTLTLEDLVNEVENISHNVEYYL